MFSLLLVGPFIHLDCFDASCKSFGDISDGGVCSLLNVMELDGTRFVDARLAN